jgi:hypothetical protein
MARTLDRVEFITRLKKRFPVIEDGISKYARGLLHCEMGCFAQATQAAIDNGDFEAVKDHFAFADELLCDASPELENAIQVSYLEYLRFEDRMAGPNQARKLLTPRLTACLADLEQHMAKLFGGEGRS